MSTKQEIRKAEAQRKTYRDNYLSLFCALFHNSVEVENIPQDLPKRYLLRNLLNKGAIAYDYETKLFLPFIGSLIDAYGLPQKYQLYGYNGQNFWRKANEVAILRANDICYPVKLYIEQQANKLVEIDTALFQNLEAIKTTTFITVSDKSTLLSLDNADYARRVGSAVVFVDKNLGIKEALSGVTTGVQFNADKLQELKTEIWNDTLNTLGIPTANTSKKERVQSAEVEASNFYAKNCIKTLVDTFNYDAEVGELDIRFKENTVENINNSEAKK